jgi:transposase
MLDVLKVRIYPNKEQEISLAKSFGCSRFVWNFYLNKTNNQYEETGKSMTYCPEGVLVTPSALIPMLTTRDHFLCTPKIGKIVS